MEKKIEFITLQVHKIGSIPYEPEQWNSSTNSYSFLIGLIGKCEKELFIVISLNAHNEPNAIEICSIGTSERAVVEPKEVFKSALLSNASKIIIAHNHPTGHTIPSEADYQVTRQIKILSDLLNLPLLDHIIIGHDDYYSFAEHGLL